MTTEVVPTISRMEYLALLSEAFEEGVLMRGAEAAQYTKDEFYGESFWAQYPKELVDEFYVAYRRGYIKGIIKGDKNVTDNNE